MKYEKAQIDQLTGLRFFAALLVFFSHIAWENSFYAVRKLAEQGYVGVSFFFILSGFVLSYSYKERIITGGISFKRFVYLRLARLMPLHWLTAVPFVFYLIISGSLEVHTIFINLFFLQSFIPDSSIYFSLNAPSWSLSNEMFFYIIFFFIAGLFLKNLLKIFIILSIFILITAYAVNESYPDYILFGNRPLNHWLFAIFPVYRFIEFLSGMILYLIWSKGFRLNIMCFPFSYLLLLLCMFFAEYIPESFRFSVYYMPAMLLFFYVHLTESRMISNIYANRIAILLGRASFAFYLIHQPIIRLAHKIMESIETNDFLFAAIALIVTIGLSIGVYQLFEERVGALLRKKLAGSGL